MNMPHATEAADNLLKHCAGITQGTHVLFVNEHGKSVDPDVVAFLELRARTLGAVVTSLYTPRAASPEAIPADVMQAIDESPCTIFNHQLGPMLRLLPVRGAGIRVLNYATTWPILTSDFALVPHGLWNEVMGKLVPELGRARTWRIQCADGTDVHGTSPAPRPGAGPGGFTLRTFPMDTHPPVPTTDAQGRIALRWLVTSAMHDLGTEGLAFDQPVFAIVEDGSIARFEGHDDDCRTAARFLEGIGARFQKHPYRINSWHAGINPRTRVAFRADESLEQWMQLAHSSPRILHFHVVGDTVPGEISAAVVDPTVHLDGMRVWHRGTFEWLQREPYSGLAAQMAPTHRPFEAFADIGI
ncbi:MAG: hypothetical protein JSR18_05745 [Proteobacteria bacterium]|nr:hypothetical protein [Pseudomonadota bacterium]